MYSVHDSLSLGRASSEPHSYVLTWLSVTIYIIGIDSKHIVWIYMLSQMNSSVFSHTGLRSGSSFPSWMIGIVHSTLDPRFMRVSLTWPRHLTVLTTPSWATCYQLLVWVALNSVGLRAICMNEASAPLLNSISHLLHAFHPVCPKDQFLALYSSSSTTGDYPALYLRAAPCLLTTPSCTTTVPASTANHPAVVLGMIFLVWTRGRVNGAPPLTLPNPLTCWSPVIAAYEISLHQFQVCPSQVMSFPWLGLQSIL